MCSLSMLIRCADGAVKRYEICDRMVEPTGTRSNSHADGFQPHVSYGMNAGRLSHARCCRLRRFISGGS